MLADQEPGDLDLDPKQLLFLFFLFFGRFFKNLFIIIIIIINLQYCIGFAIHQHEFL